MSREVRLSDRIKELSYDPGTSAFTLAGAANGFSPFADFYSSGDIVYYAATDGTRYEVGSGEYTISGSSKILTRYPLRSNNLTDGPYYINAPSAREVDAGVTGYWYPLYLTKSAASGVKGYPDSASSVHEHTFSGFPGVTFYMPNTHAGHANPWGAHVSGVNYATSGAAMNMQGVTEVYVTYPGKYSVYSAGGVSGFKEPKHGGVAVWGTEQILDYDENIVWNFSKEALGVYQSSPIHPVDVGGLPSYSQVRASGFIDGGSGIQFSGGQALPQSALKTASGGRQLEPFFRNELDSQTKSDQVLSLSGLVDQRILLQKQVKGSIFAGPASGCTSTCSPDYPDFRYLELEDIPDLSSLYVVQKNPFDAGLINVGSIPHYSESGKIQFDPLFVYKEDQNRLGINTVLPQATLDVNGNIKASGDIDSSGNIHTTGDLDVGGNVTISGSLDVQGSLTYIDSTQVTVLDKQLELASMSGVAKYTDQVIDSGGLVLKSTSSISGDKTFVYAASSGAWVSNQNLFLDSGGLAIKFTSGPDISGGYHAGSGLEIHNNIEFNVGNLFQVSGEDGTNGYIHQAGKLIVSGISGIDSSFTKIGNDGRLTLTLTDLFQVSGEDGNNGSINQGSILTVSGISGIDATFTQIGTSGRVKIDPTLMYNTLSGTLLSSHQMISGALHSSHQSLSGAVIQAEDASAFRILASGGPDGAGTPGVFISDTIKNQALVVSGISGIMIDYESANKTLFINPSPVSGYFETRIGSLGGGYGNWKIHAESGTKSTQRALDSITTGQALTVSGISGVSINYNATHNELKISVGELSGKLVEAIDGSGNASQFFIRTSGVASPHATSGNIFNGKILTISGVSGIDTHINPAADGSSNFIEISAASISGWVNRQINTSGNEAVEVASGFAKGYTNDEIAHVSGAVSGYFEARVGGLGGGYSHWKIHSGSGIDGADNKIENITSAQQVSFSGLSGIGVFYDVNHNSLQINPAPLSGYFESRVGGLGGSYGSWKVHAPSGTLAAQRALDSMTSGTVLNISGVSGIDVTFGTTSTLKDLRISAGQLSGFAVHKAGAEAAAASGAISGYFHSVIGGLAGGYGNWKLHASGGSQSMLLDSITTNQALTISGVSGVIVDYAVANNNLRISANPLSGYFETRVGSLAGGYNHWKLHASGGGGSKSMLLDNIITQEALTISGVSGINVDYVASGNHLQLSSAPLSGYLVHKIASSVDASGNLLGGMIGDSGNTSTFWTLSTSGVLWSGGKDLGSSAGDSSGNYKVFNNQILHISGVSGIETYYTPSGYASGNKGVNLLQFSAAPLSGYVNWNVAISGNELRSMISNSGNTNTFWTLNGSGVNGAVYNSGTAVSGDNRIYNNHTLHISGVSGIESYFSGNSSAAGSSGINLLQFSAAPLSGWVTHKINASGNLVRDMLGDSGNYLMHGISGIQVSGNHLLGLINASGNAVSGWAQVSFNEVGLTSITHAGSGLIKTTVAGGARSLHLNVEGTGAIGHLYFKERGNRTLSIPSGEIIKIGREALSGTLPYAAESGSVIAIGSKAGLGASGISRNVFIGYNAGAYAGNPWGTPPSPNPYKGATDLIAIGSNAGAHVTASGGGSGPDAYGIYIGQQAGYGAVIGASVSQESDHIAIGKYAGWGASSINDAIHIGNSAASGSQFAGRDVIIGPYAYTGHVGATFFTYNAAIGWESLKDSKFAAGVVSIGRSTAKSSVNSYNNNNVGFNASASSSGTSYNISIGDYAGYAASGSSAHASDNQLFVTSIGAYAGAQSCGAKDSVYIGYGAGYNTTNMNDGSNKNVYNVYIGRYAGKDRSGKRNLILQPGVGTSTSDLASWASSSTDEILQIGLPIAAKSYNMQIGKGPSAETDLSNKTLSIEPNAATDTVLHLGRALSQSAPVLSVDNQNGNTNEVITNDGRLRIPTCSSAGGEFYDQDGDLVNREDGVIIFWVRPDSQRYLLVCAGGTWHRVIDSMHHITY